MLATSYDTTPRGRRIASKGSTPKGRGSTSNNSWRRAGDAMTPLRGPRNEKERHYMPRQGLFEGEHVLDMFDHSSDGDGERSCPPSVFYQSRPSPYSIPSNSVSTPSRMSDFNATAPLEPSINFVSLLQEQQGMLKNIMKQQEDMQKQQEKFIDKQKAFEDKVAELEDLLHESSGSSDNKKSRVPRQLSNIVATVHEGLENGFNGAESSLSAHNKSVKENLMKSVVSEKYSEAEVKRAVQRRYETIRRQQLVEEKENSADLIEAQAKANKYRARRIRKFNNRGQIVKPSEEQYWKYITPYYMTEESDNSSDEMTIVEHKLCWRSHRLDKYMIELDKIYDAKVCKEGGAVMAKKKREEGAPSSSKPPNDTPAWAIRATDSDDSEKIQD